MNDVGTSRDDELDVLREYCRRIEDHLTRVNGGHLVRIVGPGFSLVREWASEGVPLSIVFQGVTLKAERHRAGRSTRPLRLEFCRDDVRAIYDDWRRAVGLFGPVSSGAPAEAGGDAQSASDSRPSDKRTPSLTKHLERVTDRLSRAAGRLDLPDPLRDAIARWLDEASVLREQSRHARGAARTPMGERLGVLDQQMAETVRLEAPAAEAARAEQDALADLAAYRTRLAPDIWQRSLVVTIDRLLRDRLGLPIVTFQGNEGGQ